jgi:lipopolysaccharide export system protein LptA
MFIIRFVLLLLMFFPLVVHALPAKSNMDEPLNITADNLVVLQDNAKAVFSGNVVAIQGTTHLKSDKMTVFYRSSDRKRSSESAISRVEVLGHVVLTTPEESAESNTGYYDMDGGLIKLTGDVRLNQKGNIITGQDFVHNMHTGQSQMLNQAAGAGKKGRVQMYIPNLKNAKKPEAKHE